MYWVLCPVQAATVTAADGSLPVFYYYCIYGGSHPLFVNYRKGKALGTGIEVICVSERGLPLWDGNSGDSGYLTLLTGIMAVVGINQLVHLRFSCRHLGDRDSRRNMMVDGDNYSYWR